MHLKITMAFGSLRLFLLIAVAIEITFFHPSHSSPKKCPRMSVCTAASYYGCRYDNDCPQGNLCCKDRRTRFSVCCYKQHKKNKHKTAKAVLNLLSPFLSDVSLSKDAGNCPRMPGCTLTSRRCKYDNDCPEGNICCMAPETKFSVCCYKQTSKTGINPVKTVITWLRPIFFGDTRNKNGPRKCHMMPACTLASRRCKYDEDCPRGNICCKDKGTKVRACCHKLTSEAGKKPFITVLTGIANILKIRKHKHCPLMPACNLKCRKCRYDEDCPQGNVCCKDKGNEKVKACCYKQTNETRKIPTETVPTVIPSTTTDAIAALNRTVPSKITNTFKAVTTVTKATKKNITKASSVPTITKTTAKNIANASSVPPITKTTKNIAKASSVPTITKTTTKNISPASRVPLAHDAFTSSSISELPQLEDEFVSSSTPLKPVQACTEEKCQSPMTCLAHEDCYGVEHCCFIDNCNKPDNCTGCCQIKKKIKL